MKKVLTVILTAVFCVTACKKEVSSELSDGLYAEIETDKGNIVLQLEQEKTPLTVANFVSLAEGNNPLVDAQYKNKPFYDGLIFHRVIGNFMIQGGDPTGTGEGGPGYRFKDEFVSDLKHDKPGVLSMANAGPATNGSQFFITHSPQPHLDGMHTVFGHVVSGQEVVNAIAQGDKIKKVNIIRVGEVAKKFDAPKVFKEQLATAQKEEESKTAAISQVINDNRVRIEEGKTKAIKTKNGVGVYVFEKGQGGKPKVGEVIQLDYAGFFEDGKLFDTGIEAIAEKFNAVDPQRKAAHQYIPIPFSYGKKEGLIPGFIEGIEQLSIGDKALIYIPAHLAYGERGAPPVIAPNTDLVFELHISK